MKIDELKYITFRRGDIPPEVFEGLENLELTDAVVIRKRDKLAAGALHSYATACWTTADVLIEAGRQKDADELTAIGNYFNEQYEEARRMQDHLPTL